MKEIELATFDGICRFIDSGSTQGDVLEELMLSLDGKPGVCVEIIFETRYKLTELQVSELEVFKNAVRSMCEERGIVVKFSARTRMAKARIIAVFSEQIDGKEACEVAVKSVQACEFEKTAQEIGRMVAEKNAAYGDSFAKCDAILRALYPNGINPEQYRDALGVTRVVDKLFRVANRKDAFGEDPWRDIAGYGLVSVVQGGRP